MPGETSLVSHIRSLAAAQSPNRALLRGIGDDCAILRPRPHHDLVFTTDFMLEGRHFTLDSHKPTDIGHKALARSLSDLAAMGSRPLFCLVSLALPNYLGKRWISSFYGGFLKLADHHNVSLAGGDLASFDKVIADVLCCGEVPKGKALLRSGAKPGDRIYVTGELGASANGLATGKGTHFRRHLRPEPRIAAGLALHKWSIRCCMDLSDGLALDLHRLCLESNVSAALLRPLPIARHATEEQALTGGEDYELLFTAPSRSELPTHLEDLPITEIGIIESGEPGKLTLDGRPLMAQGFQHFG